MPAIPLLFILIALFFEVSQLIDLMARHDDEFPGRFDKPIWAAIILTLPLVGAIVYYQQKPSKDLRERRLAKERAEQQSNDLADGTKSGEHK